MKLVFQIALGIIFAPILLVLLLGGAVVGLVYIKWVLIIGGLVLAGVIVQRKVYEREAKPVEYTYKGEMGSTGTKSLVRWLGSGR